MVVAGTHSGCGKTTVATGLMAVLRAGGLRVAGFKVGPDFIDPSYHSVACGRPGRNLDAFLSGPGLVGPLFAHGARGCDVAVVEGVMGLHDGRAGAGEEASTAQVAKLLSAPVLLVVDARSMARSAAAVVLGFRALDPGVDLAGVVLNGVGSERHEWMLREAVEPLGVPVVGVLRRLPELELSSRHLGLVPAVEEPSRIRRVVDGLGTVVGTGLDLERVLAIARGAPGVAAAPWSPAPQEDGRRDRASGSDEGKGDNGVEGTRVAPGAETARGAGGAEEPQKARAAEQVEGARAITASRFERAPAGSWARAAPGTEGLEGAGGVEGVGRACVAVAEGPAFSFVYRENLEMLSARGAGLAAFDPATDEAIPPGARVLYLGGGFPEVHAAALSANESMRASVRAFVAAGGAVVAECGGLLYLCRSLDGAPMCGVLEADAAMTGRVTLGYRTATAARSWLFEAGTPVRAHEFHYASVTPGAGRAPAWLVGERAEGFVERGVHASFLHGHWAATPGVPDRVVERALGRAA